MTQTGCDRSRPRERILDTARDLFRRCGIRGAGVDAIAETAGTNKMTLYRHFHSKDDLVVACLEAAAVEVEEGWADIEAAHPLDPRAQLDAWVGMIDARVRGGFGCEAANAAVELPEASETVRATIAAFKTGQRRRLVRLCEAAGIVRAEALADMLSLLIEGARVSRQAVGEGGPSDSFPQCAHAAIDAFANEPAMPSVVN